MRTDRRRDRGRTGSAVGAGDEHTRERDAHRGATLLTLLVFLWGLISLLVDPWEPFGVPDVFQTVCGGALLVYFLRTWNRPRRRVADAVATILIVYTLLLVPWTAVEWCRLGRPMDALTIPQVGAVCMAFVFPGRWWLGMTAMGLFVAESLFVFVYARHLGLDALIPVTEPLGTFFFTVVGLGLFILRHRRRDLARQYVRVQGEIQALDRVRPICSHARDQLQSQVPIIAGEIDDERGSDVTNRRSVTRSARRPSAARSTA